MRERLIAKAKKHGKGTYKWLDGSFYEGDFDKDLRQGVGLFKWSNGESYKGDYLADQRTGEGLYLGRMVPFTKVLS